ncbi:hypothetical protein NQ227_25165, partial [Escherichia coli]|nr:hypothetical protein [Escherichia coli]
DAVVPAWTIPDLDDRDGAAQGIDLVRGQREILDIEPAIAEAYVAAALQRDLMKATGIERNADRPPKIDGSTALFAGGTELDVAVDVD